jgi:hypothetical protein
MICSHVHDFVRGTKIALPRLVAERSSHSFQVDIVRPNQSADQIVAHHLKALEALKVSGKPKITKH